MNLKYTLKAFAGILMLFLAASLFSCDSDEPGTGPSDSFFPLTENSQWEYEYNHFFKDPEGSVPYYTVNATIRVQGDTTLEGKTYKRLIHDSNGAIQKVVRQEGSRYFVRNHGLYGGFSKEYMFLDTAVPLNGTWSYGKDDHIGSVKTEYTVKARHAWHNLNGNLFRNVMEVEVTYYVMNGETMVPWYSTNHYYAKGIGEIYAYYPSPASDRYSDLDISLVKSN